MNAKIYYEKDTDLDLLKSKKVAIIGYGSQGHAHAQNLRDSGVEVIIGELAGTENAKMAEDAGFKVMSAEKASAAADWIQMLVPDDVQAAIYAGAVKDNLESGNVIGFSHGFNIHYGQIEPPENVDVVMVAPKGPGHLVRRMYEEGKGTPCLAAVHQDSSGKAMDMALAYAAGIGGARAGVLQTTFEEETETDLFGEQAVLCGGLAELIKTGFETLIDAGYQPEVAYFECLHEMKLITDLVQESGIAGMNYSISDTAEYGEYSRGYRVITEDTRLEMEAILGEIQSGEFAREWLLENRVNKPVLKQSRKNLARHPIEIIGKKLRGMMPWLKK